MDGGEKRGGTVPAVVLAWALTADESILCLKSFLSVGIWMRFCVRSKFRSDEEAAWLDLMQDRPS